MLLCSAHEQVDSLHERVDSLHDRLIACKKASCMNALIGCMNALTACMDALTKRREECASVYKEPAWYGVVFEIRRRLRYSCSLI